MSIAHDVALAAQDAGDDLGEVIVSGYARSERPSFPRPAATRPSDDGAQPVRAASSGTRVDGRAREGNERDQAADAGAPTDARAVLAALYAAHARPVQRFLRDLLGDATLAADATQETFARAFRRIETVRHDERRSGWLFGIARNVSLEYRKARRTARGRFSDGDEVDAAPCGGRSPEAQLLGQEAAAIVQGALVRLPEERRAALLLRADHGLSYEEVAAALGWTVAKARVEVFRAREVLRAALDGEEGDAR